MTSDPDFASVGRWLSRLSVMAALASCSLNCVVGQAAAVGRLRPLTDWASALVVLAGIALGAAGLARGVRSKSLDTTLIAAIGLALNLGIVFVVVWYFAVVRPRGA